MRGRVNLAERVLIEVAKEKPGKVGNAASCHHLILADQGPRVHPPND